MPGIVTATGWLPIHADDAAERSTKLNPAGPEDDEDENDLPIDGRAKPVKIRKIAAMKARAGDLTPRSRQARNEFARQLRKFLSDQKMRVSKKAAQEFAAYQKVSRGTLYKDADSTEERDKRLAEIIALLGWDYETLYGLSAPYLEVAAQEGVHAGAYQAAANLGAPLQSTLADALPKAKQAADARAAQMTGFDLEEDGSLTEAAAPQWAISTTAKDSVLTTLKQAVAEGWTRSSWRRCFRPVWSGRRSTGNSSPTMRSPVSRPRAISTPGWFRAWSSNINGRSWTSVAARYAPASRPLARSQPAMSLLL